MSRCVTCDADDTSGEQLVACDRCDLTFCQTCSRMTPTEMRSAVLKKKRIMIFLCPECKLIFNDRVQSDGGRQDHRSEKDEVCLTESKVRDIVTEVIETLIPRIMKGQISELMGQMADVKTRVNSVLHNLMETGVLRNTDNAASESRKLKSKRDAVSVPGFHKREAPPPAGDQHDSGLKLRSSAELKARSRSSSSAGTVIQAGKVCYAGGNQTLGANRSHPGDIEVADSVGGQITLSQVSRGVEMALDVLEGGIQTGCEQDQAGFQRVESRRTRQRRRVAAEGQRGTAVDVGGFMSEPRKMWLYVGRAGNRTDVNLVREYVGNKLGIEGNQLVVEALQTAGVTKSYKIGVDHLYYDRVNKSDFWPEGILFRRFRFGSGKRSISSSFTSVEGAPVKM